MFELFLLILIIYLDILQIFYTFIKYLAKTVTAEFQRAVYILAMVMTEPSFGDDIVSSKYTNLNMPI